MDDLAEKIIDAKTPADAKAIASRVLREFHKDWHSLKVWVMKDILHAKADYCKQFKNALIESGEKPLVECTSDLFWASGLSPRDTSTTHPSFYPGINNLGRVFSQVRAELIKEAVLMNQIDVDSPENISTSQPAHHPEVKPDTPVVPVSTSSTDFNVTSSVYSTSSNTSAILTLSTSPDSSTPAVMNNKTTTTHINAQNLSDSSEYDISNNTLSGIEELSLTQNDSTSTSDVHKGESPDNSDQN